ncbi:MAG: NADH-ubiquinone oxidoreductase-F iron-sulfur binding region domain-containing protein [Elusimicrobiota bacterium]
MTSRADNFINTALSCLPEKQKDAFLSAAFGKGDWAPKAAVLRHEDVRRPIIYVGAGTCGLAAGAGKTLEAVKAWLKKKKIQADVLEVGCIGYCAAEPLLDVRLPDMPRVSFERAKAETVGAILDSVFTKRAPLKDNLLFQFDLEGGKKWPGVPLMSEHPFFKDQVRFVLKNCGLVNPVSIQEYIARGGYSAFLKSLHSMTPVQVCQDVEASGLRGRGGGGFPTGKKWKMALNSDADQKYIICNADEGDPGAFMDRAVIEGDPHRVLEGLAIGAYAIHASKAYVYIRAEYPLAVKNLRKAIEDARKMGLIGENIYGSGFDLDVIIKMGAGAFVCGEETALMHSIEGKRGMPKPRPPYPTVRGLFDKPTVINNVETLANVPSIMGTGVDNFARMGTKTSKGTKVFALSGVVRRTGLVEIPMGTSLRQVVFDIGGGIPNGKKCKAVQIGGPSGGCIPEAHLDIECDYEALKNFGAIMGSGGLVVLDENTCMVDLAKYFMEFIQNESCGKCIHCRDGTRRMLEILQAITRPRRKEDGLDALFRFQGVMLLKELGEVIRKTSLCGLGQTAPNPVLSTLKWFRDEYEAHIFERRCPAGACRELVGAPCQSGCPVGTEVWRYVAHVSRGEYEDAYRTIRSANPFPSVCARVCDHPCEDICRCGTTGGEPIAIRTLKRFVVENVSPSAYKRAPAPSKPGAPAIAVIGAGPSGLTAAHQLSMQGYKVTVFEKESKPGGMLVCGIPQYRLPRAVLEKEINAILNVNVKLKCNKALGRDFTLESLAKDGFKAIYVALGSHKSKKLGLEGEEREGVIPGIKFLKAHNLQGKALARGRVGIIGGGNSALDAARVAIRQKGVKAVTVFYRRSREEMPAYAEEIEAALQEGVKLEVLEAPTGLVFKNGRLAGVSFMRNELGPRDSSGRARPVPVEGSAHTVELDTLIAAIGEEPEAQALAGLTLSKSGLLVINGESHSTGKPGVFAGGDVTTGSNTVINSIAAGKNAALMIDRFLTGRQMRVIKRVRLPSVYVEPVQAAADGGAEGRIAPVHLAARARAKNFREVDLCVPEKHALCEAGRCLRCDVEFTQPD